MLKIAVATTDGQKIDEHFGRAKSFRIYDVDDAGHFTFVEERSISPVFLGDDIDHLSEAAVARLADVTAVRCTRTEWHHC